ncbi:MAG: ATP-binding protein [Verrucomicrobiae bacterium]|nr:ATP-binding protein [Verrucomicrobiae bacterium]
MIFVENDSVELVALPELVEHSESVQATETVEAVYNWFQRHQQEYIGVLSDKKYLGLVSRGQVGFLLGARFGIAIYGRQPIGAHLIEHSLHVTASAPLLSVLESALSRSGELFYDDVALVDDAGEYLGIITVPTLVRWQSRLILEKKQQAETHQRILEENNQQLFRSLHELRQSRGRYEILFENSALGVALLNARGEMETCNRRLESLLGLEHAPEPPGLEPRNISGYLMPRERAVFLRLLQDHESNPASAVTRTTEFMLQLPGRGPRLFKFFSNWVHETGQICILLDDITEQRVLEHRLVQKEKSALLDSLVGGIAHEINNKLAPIVGYIDLLQSDIAGLKEVETLVPYCETIRNAALESAKIIRQLLQLSRPLVRELAVVDFRDLFKDVRALVTFRLRESNCQVETQFQPEPALIHADAAQIKQIIINLIFNAVDAMENAPVRRLRFAIKEQDENIIFEVTDTGHGIKPENLDRIFNPFFTTKPVDRGSGLGLSVSLSIVKSHGGDITVENTAEGGARFTVTLPRATEEQIKTPATGNGADFTSGRIFTPSSANGRLRVLIADDEEFITAMVQAALRQNMPCSVERVESGQRAVTRLQQADFDFVISDVRMPGMDGFAVFEWILKHQPRLARRFLFITGDAGSSNLNEKLESMAVPVLRKPFEIDALLFHCRELLQAR